MKKLLVFFALVPVVLAQVTINEPVEWVTQRSRDLVIQATLDTAKLGTKKISFKTSHVRDGKEAKRLSTKSFAISQSITEFDLGKLPSSVIGGKDFVIVDWEVVPDGPKGLHGPIGVFELEEVNPAAQATIPYHGAPNWKAAHTISLKGGQISLASAEKGLYVRLNAPQNDAQPLYFLQIDGKSGKLAFSALADRAVGVDLKADTLFTHRHSRRFTREEISYTKTSWFHEIELKKVAAGSYEIYIPWHDLAIIPFDGRGFGLAVFAGSAHTEFVDAWPQKANPLIPGTWAHVKLSQ